MRITRIFAGRKEKPQPKERLLELIVTDERLPEDLQLLDSGDGRSFKITFASSMHPADQLVLLAEMIKTIADGLDMADNAPEMYEALTAPKHVLETLGVESMAVKVFDA